MKYNLIFLILLIFQQLATAQNNKPLVSINEILLDEQAKQINIKYDVEDTDNTMVDVHVLYSSNAGQDYKKIENASGDFGAAIQVGTGLEINWTYTDELSGDGDYMFKVVADDKESYDIEEIINQVDQTMLMEDMLKVVGERNRANPAHLNEVKALFDMEFESSGIELEKQTWSVGTYEATNFIGTQKGLLEADKIYINDAHYDTVVGSPGADDNGSGTVGVLAALKILSQYDFEKTIKFIFFDMEEDGLVGSINYVSNIAAPQSLNIQGVFNYEMIGFYTDEAGTQSLPAGFELLFPDAYQAFIDGGSRGNFITNVANVNSNPLKNTFDEMAAQYVPELRVISFAAIGNSEIAPDLRRSDHTPFWEASYQALMLTDGANFRNANYHEDSDTEETIDYDFMANVIKATIASIAHLAVPIHAGFDEDVLSINTSNTQVLKADKILIYPTLLNESSKSITINLEEHDIVFNTISFFDINGKLIFEKSIRNNSNFELEIPNLETGLYLVRLSNEADSLTKYIVKQ